MQVLQEQKPVTPLTYIPVGDAVIEPLRRKNANHELLEVPYSGKTLLFGDDAWDTSVQRARGYSSAS